MLTKEAILKLTLRGTARADIEGVGGDNALGFDTGLLKLITGAETVADLGIRSIRIRAIANNNVATVSVDDVTVTATTGSPVWSGTNGKAFDGAALNFSDLRGILIVAGSLNAGTVAVASADTALPDVPALKRGQIVASAIDFAVSGAAAFSTGDIGFTFSNAQDIVTIHLIGAVG